MKVARTQHKRKQQRRNICAQMLALVCQELRADGDHVLRQWRSLKLIDSGESVDGDDAPGMSSATMGAGESAQSDDSRAASAQVDAQGNAVEGTLLQTQTGAASRAEQESAGEACAGRHGKRLAEEAHDELGAAPKRASSKREVKRPKR